MVGFFIRGALGHFLRGFRMATFFVGVGFCLGILLSAEYSCSAIHV